MDYNINIYFRDLAQIYIDRGSKIPEDEDEYKIWLGVDNFNGKNLSVHFRPILTAMKEAGLVETFRQVNMSDAFVILTDKGLEEVEKIKQEIK